MSSLSVLKLQLELLHQLQRRFQSPVDLEPLQNLILLEEESGSQSSSTGGQRVNYTDFLLPLPAHLQPTETGVTDPDAITQRRTELGLNRPINAAQQIQKHDLTLQHKPRSRPLPKPGGPSRKAKIAPRPGGYISREGES